MPRITPESQAAARAEFLKEAAQAYDRMFSEGPVTFAEREDLACELGDGLTRRLLEEHLAEEELADPGVQVLCPICQRPVICDSPERAELETRRVRTKRGAVEYERAARRCKHCRRVFFPRG